MSTIEIARHIPLDVQRDFFFVVWIETNLGESSLTDWQMNSDPQRLGRALYESAECKRLGFPSTVLPEGSTPRPDGSFE